MKCVTSKCIIRSVMLPIVNFSAHNKIHVVNALINEKLKIQIQVPKVRKKNKNTTAV